jgi:hypothetical protein
LKLALGACAAFTRSAISPAVAPGNSQAQPCPRGSLLAGDSTAMFSVLHQRFAYIAANLRSSVSGSTAGRSSCRPSHRRPEPER